MAIDLQTRKAQLESACQPFGLLSGNRLREALEAVRTYELGPGEEIRLRPEGVTHLLFVIEGQVDLQVSGTAETAHLESFGTQQGPYRLEPGGHSVLVSARNTALIGRIDSEILDYLLSWEALSGGVLEQASLANDRVALVRKSLAFRRLPLEMVTEAFRRMRTRAVTEGEVIVSQGDVGDAYSVIESGRAEVWQLGLYDDEPQLVATLGSGDPFGEEALIKRGTRGATVKMSSDGVLWVLNQHDFDELFHRTMIQHVPATVAQALISSGHIPLDVRYDEELEEGYIPGARHLPLHELRSRVNELNVGQRYVVYCKSGGRSSVGAMLLTQRGFNAVSLEGGTRDWPYELTTAG